MTKTGKITGNICARIRTLHHITGHCRICNLSHQRQGLQHEKEAPPRRTHVAFVADHVLTPPWVRHRASSFWQNMSRCLCSLWICWAASTMSILSWANSNERMGRFRIWRRRAWVGSNELDEVNTTYCGTDWLQSANWSEDGVQWVARWTH